MTLSSADLRDVAQDGSRGRATTSTPPLSPELWAGTLPRQWVHKRSCSEVYLTSWRPRGPHMCEVGAQWPRQHSYYSIPSPGSRTPRHDVLLVAETLRQSVIYTAHQLFGVALGSALSMNGLSVHLLDEGALVRDSPTELLLHLECEDVRRDHHDGLRSSTVYVTFRTEGQVMGVGRGDLTVLSAGIYARLRRGRTPTTVQPRGPGLDPGSVGRRSNGDVLLDRAGVVSGKEYELRLDTTHPILFDHPLDHVPGMLLVDAARQAVTAAVPDVGSLTGFDATFGNYVELDSPCAIHVQPAGGDGDRDGDGDVDTRWRVSFKQGGGETAVVTLTSTPRAGRLARLTARGA